MSHARGYSKGFDRVDDSGFQSKLSASGVPVSPTGLHHFWVSASSASVLGTACLIGVQIALASCIERCMHL